MLKQLRFWGVRCSVVTGGGGGDFLRSFQCLDGIRTLRETGLYKGLGLKVIDNVDDANFILVHGTEALDSPSDDIQTMRLEDLEGIMEMSVKRNLPMVAANPDFATVEAKAQRPIPGGLLSPPCHDIKWSKHSWGLHMYQSPAAFTQMNLDWVALQRLQKLKCSQSYVLPAFA